MNSLVSSIANGQARVEVLAAMSGFQSVLSSVHISLSFALVFKPPFRLNRVSTFTVTFSFSLIIF